MGLPFFSGQASGLRRLPQAAVDFNAIQQGKTIEFEFTPPGETPHVPRGRASAPSSTRTPIRSVALVVATPQAQLSNQAMRLVLRLAIALLVGLLVTAALAWYLSGRITRPVRRLALAADEVAEGRYETQLPEVTGRDEIADLTESFTRMTQRLAESEELERNFLMTVSHELRTPLTAIRGHVEALREGLAEDPEARNLSLDVIAAESGRLERLVGDVLDLAKLDTRRFTVRHEEVDMARLVEQAYAAFGEEAKSRKIDYSQDVSSEPVIVTDGDRVLQIITNLLCERVPLDSERGQRRSGAERGERRDPRGGTGQWAGNRARGAGPDLPPVLDARRQGHGARAGDRSRARRRARRDDRPQERARPRQPLRARPACAALAGASST